MTEALRADMAAGGRRLQRWAPLAVVLLAFLLVAVVAGTPATRPPLDPDSTAPNGAKGLVLLLRRYGTTVVLQGGAPGPEVRTALVLSDALDGPRRAALGRWVEAGGHLVVADPTSPLQLGAATPVGNGLTSKDLHLDGPCDLDGLADISRIDVGPSLVLRRPPGSAERGCFSTHIAAGAENGDASFLLEQPAGQGVVTALGGGGVWSNRLLASDDNAAVALGLLAPAPGATLDILVPAPVGNGHESTYRLLGPRLKLGLYGLVIAFVIAALWQGRRLGRPVEESQPVQLAGSEIVVAVGDLLSRTGARDAAAAELRAGSRRLIGERLGLGPAAPADRIADVAHARAGVDPQWVWSLLADSPLPDEAALVTLAGSLAQLRQEVTRG